MEIIRSVQTDANLYIVPPADMYRYAVAIINSAYVFLQSGDNSYRGVNI